MVCEGMELAVVVVVVDLDSVRGSVPEDLVHLSKTSK
jgi:hypothetical protein